MRLLKGVAGVALAVSALSSHAFYSWNDNGGLTPTTTNQAHFSGNQTATFGFDLTGSTTIASLIVSGLGIDLVDVSLNGLSLTPSVAGAYEKWTGSFSGALGHYDLLVTVASGQSFGTYNGVLYFNPAALDTNSLTAAAVPEPETYAMLVAGLGAIGFLSRRRKPN